MSELSIWKAIPVVLLLVLLSAIPAACRMPIPPSPGNLTLQEYLLEAPPDSDAGSFQPRGTSQSEVLAHRSDLRSQAWDKMIEFREGLPTVTSLGSGKELKAILTSWTEESHRQKVDVLKSGRVVFTADAGLPSPAFPVQGLWSWGDHWAVEILLADQEHWKGIVYLDGVSLNQRSSYQEAFNFQLLAGEPFYFFRKDDRLGYSFGGVEYDLVYDEIVHYQCCSASSLNPVQAENLTAFFARQREDWYYVEIGTFSK